MANKAPDAILIADSTVSADTSGKRDLNMAAGATIAVAFIALLLAAIWGPSLSNDLNPNEAPEALEGDQVYFTWNEPEYMPRHEECIDPDNGQDAGYEGYGIGYEPSLSIDSQGNLFVTAHKDLRWGGEEAPIPVFLGEDPGFWYSCTSDREAFDPNSGAVQTSWDYWASWFWISNDNGETWGHGDNFEPTPGGMLRSLAGSATGSGSECLGDEGDIAVDANDVVYYLDTTLEDNWWHIFEDGGNTYASPSICERMNTMAADDRPWVSAQGDGIIHYLGNSGASPPECSGDSGRYWYYRSETGHAPYTQCYAMPGGWSTISSQNNGPYVFVAQEDADSDSGVVQVRISDDYGDGTGPGPADGSWQTPVEVGPREGNCPEGYPVVNNNEGGMVVVTWADCPNGNTGAWELRIAVSYDNGSSWESWNATAFDRGINMYPFVSITEDQVVSVAFYGLDFDQNNSDDGYVAGKDWYLYAGALHHPMEGDVWDFRRIDPTPLHTVTAYEESSGDTHALHDFFETVMSPDGSWMGIAYQENIGLHPFEENEEQRYIKFIRGDMASMHSIVSESDDSSLEMPVFSIEELILAARS
ncbi:MAG: hypothetical protein ACKVKS_03010 [Candidatus Poseidoniales archaeon]|jgi:hypothetical protein|tara:strand:- start:3 stop:1766 length:1764 start_codon:yes stop_codon:yes gene_type:complete